MLFLVANAANAIQVFLVGVNETSSSGTLYTLITDGSVAGLAPATTATFDWNGTTLTSVGTYGAAQTLGSSPYGPTIRGDSVTDLTIITGIAATAGGSTAYSCTEGTFLGGVANINGCGGYSFGTNFTDESTTIWAGLGVTQTIGGDDAALAPAPFPPWNFAIRTISAYGLGSVALLSGASTISQNASFTIGNGTPQGSGGAFDMTFQVIPVPAAAWLFGSALGILGWVRRRAA